MLGNLPGELPTCVHSPGHCQALQERDARVTLALLASGGLTLSYTSPKDEESNSNSHTMCLHDN